MATNYTPDMLATLDLAIAQGTRSVYYGDKRVEYRSLDEMIRIRNIMRDELGLSEPQSGRMYAEFGTGLDDHPPPNFYCN